MKVALYNLEKKIINSAMMQVSQYHKNKGDTIEIYSPLLHDTYDKIYAFSIFTFTPKDYVTPDMEVGGTGFSITKLLPKEIEDCDYDWSLYPNCKYSIVWFSRGCIRNCKFCIVREKEGYIYPVKPKNLNPNGTFIKVMDNNFFANPNWREAVEQLREWNQVVDFQGVDLRLLDQEQCEVLNSLKTKSSIHIAWDNPRLDLTNQLDMIIKYIKPYKLQCYVLVGFDTTLKEDIYRIDELWKRKILPYIMIYDNRKDNKVLRHLARWCNNRIIFKSCTFKDYLVGKYMILKDELEKCDLIEK
jgi:hypothetical protein